MKLSFKTKKQKILGAIVVLASLGVVFGGITAVIRNLPFNRAVNAYIQGNYAAARVAVVDHLFTNDQDVAAWILYGDILLAEGNASKAELEYKRALEIDSGSIEAQASLATLYRLSGESLVAQDMYANVLLKDPSNIKANNGMAIIMLSKGNYALALAYAEKAYANAGQSAEVAANLALIYHLNARYLDRDRLYDVAMNLNYDSLENLKSLFNQLTPLQVNADLSNKTNEEILQQHMNDVQNRNGRVQGLIDAGVN